MLAKCRTRKGGMLAGLLLGAVAVLVSLPFSAVAQQPPEDPGDAAEHGVARISLLNGDVTLIRGDAGQSSSAVMNDPLVSGDRIVVTENARAELQFDPTNILRAAPGSEVRMGDLQYHRYQIQIAQGLVTFRMLRDEPDAPVEISMPSCSLRPVRQGVYRVLVRPDGSSEITVRSGEAEVFSPAGSERLQAGNTMLTRGSVNDPEFMSIAAIPFDEWDRWNADRDRAFDQRVAETPRYASSDINGLEDLGGYGRWENDSSYGQVWVPTVSADWAPYQDGQWTWLDYYGWSWVGREPWGWAPYHYGRWFRGNYGWSWYPGAHNARNYWRPALVGFVGWGTPSFGASFGYGFGHFGWVPLAPRDSFRPWYGRGYGGGGNLSIASMANVANAYQNARFSNAVTGVRTGEFGRGRSFVHPSSGELASAGAVTAPVWGRSFAGGNRSYAGSPATSFSSARGNAWTGSSGNQHFYSSQNQVRPNNDASSGWRRFQSQQPRGGQPQPVRISPQIVNNRYGGAAGSANPNYGQNNSSPGAPQGGFGGMNSGAGRPGYQPGPPVQQNYPPRQGVGQQENQRFQNRGNQPAYTRPSYTPPAYQGNQGNRGPGGFGPPRGGGAPAAAHPNSGGGSRNQRGHR